MTWEPSDESSSEDGKQSGFWKRYQKNGKLYNAGRFVNGKKASVWKYYDAGKLKRAKTY